MKEIISMSRIRSSDRRNRSTSYESTTFEPLETRRMLSAKLAGTTLNLRATNGDDEFNVRRVGTRIIVDRNGVREGSFLMSKVQRLSVVLGDGNDTLNSVGRLPRMMVDGGKGNDRIFTSSGNDYVYSGEGNDTVVTRGGADGIDGGLGDDNLDGGTGINTLDFSKRTAGASIDLGARTAGQTGESDRVENFSIALGGKGNDTIVGSALVNELHGNGGNDRLVASGELDELYGGAGNDTLVDALPTTLLDGGDGTDTADFSAYERFDGIGVDLVEGYAAGLRTRGLPDQVVEIENVIGTRHDDVIIGDDNRNLLDGRGGPDRIVGRGGIDTLLGGDGDDYLEDRDGNVDQLTGGPGNDYAAPDLNYFPFGVSSRDTLSDVIEKVGEPKPISG
jgi:Ca2+-binding RTX toxin-like protein